MAAVKNLIFDLGNVLYDIDFKKMNIAFASIGIEGFSGMSGYSGKSGIGIFTGQTSLHAPHRLDAFGRSAFCGNLSPIINGESTAPTGPG